MHIVPFSRNFRNDRSNGCYRYFFHNLVYNQRPSYSSRLFNNFYLKPLYRKNKIEKETAEVYNQYVLGGLQLKINRMFSTATFQSSFFLFPPPPQRTGKGGI